MNKTYEFRIDLSKTEENKNHCIQTACDLMQEIYNDGYYPQISIHRPWSPHNPTIDGDFARPSAYNWYLFRELKKLGTKGAQIKISPSKKRRSLNDVQLLSTIDEDDWDFTKKKLFLFQPERIEISLNRLEHYTGTNAEDFQRVILLTNYAMYMELFEKKFGNVVKPSRDGVQMPTFHFKKPNNEGVTIINIGVGPSNAKTLTDHIAVLRPDAMFMVGHCGGLRNHQKKGDFVLATSYMRGEKILDDAIPTNVPIIPNPVLNIALRKALESRDLDYRSGTVFTTADRNWEFNIKRAFRDIHSSRSIGIDMESSTIATNGFKYRIPNATLLCVSDKPLHGEPKLKDDAKRFYEHSKEVHLDVVLDAYETVRSNYPAGIPNADLRDFYEPLLGSM